MSKKKDQIKKPKECTTHHYACECREQAISQIRSIIGDAIAMLIRADLKMDELYGEEKFK